MRKQKMNSEIEKQNKIEFLLKLGFSLEEANKLRLKVASCNSYLYWMYKDNLSEEEAINFRNDFLIYQMNPNCLLFLVISIISYSI
jgi:hypothetical protein